MPETGEKQTHLDKLASALDQGKITPAAVENIRTWLTDSRYQAYVPEIGRHIDEGRWQQLDDVFWTVIPFGTGGRRGRMYPIGCNAINERTIGESAQGLAAHVIKSRPDGPWSAAIAYDTRHRSREFAELCAGILVAHGFTVYFIDQYRSTPELSFLIRFKQCDCGIMVTASHNPPSDNAVKVYWSTGGQLVPPHDAAVIKEVGEVRQIDVSDFQTAVNDGKIVMVTEETDHALLQEHVKQSFDGPRDLKIIYSPLHGVGEFNVRTLLQTVGFDQLEIYGPHREPNGDFPNVPGHVSNPENKVVFEDMIRHAQTNAADLILATDPDCDRMGAAAPISTGSSGPWNTFNGNQLGVLLCDYVLSRRRQAGTLTSENYVITTLVTTRMMQRIASSYGVRCYDNNLVGFKWIGSLMDKLGPDNFVFGCEESHGFLVGQYCRDKDGAIACMLMSELAAEIKSRNVSMFDHLDQLYRTHGYHAEDLLTIRMEGSDGMARMQALMTRFRTDMPTALGGLAVTRRRDFLQQQIVGADGGSEPLDGPRGDLIIMETATDGNYLAVRPSGTEPKVKFYLFTYVPPAEISDLNDAKSEMDQRLRNLRNDVEKIANAV